MLMLMVMVMVAMGTSSLEITKKDSVFYRAID